MVKKQPSKALKKMGVEKGMNEFVKETGLTYKQSLGMYKKNPQAFFMLAEMILIKKCKNVKFSMSMCWQVDYDYISSLLDEYGFCLEFVEQKWIDEYKEFWSRKPNCKTKQEWNYQLFRKIKYYIENP